MRVRFLLPLLVGLFAACTSFGGEDDGNPTTAGGNDGGAGGDGSEPDPLKDPTTFAFVMPKGDPPFVLQGGHVDLPITIQRGSLFHDAVQVTLVDAKTGITAGTLTIGADQSMGTLPVDVAGSVTQGPLDLALEGRDPQTHKRKGTTKIFVRGAPGTFDTTWTPVEIPSTQDNLSAGREATVLPDGRILFVRLCATGTCVERFSTDGVRDMAFGANGTLDLSSKNTPRPLGAVMTAGKVLLCGGNGDTMWLAKFDIDGHLDTSWTSGSTPGVRSYKLPASAGTFTSYTPGFSVDTQGRILIPTDAYLNTKQNAVVLRVLPNGNPDLTWGPEGWSRHPALESYYTHGFVLRGDRALLVSDQVNLHKFGLIQFGADGQPDAAFGVGGATTFPGVDGTGATAADAGIALLGDGSAIVPVVTTSGAQLARVAPDGKSLVQAFGVGGMATLRTTGRGIGQLVGLTDGSTLISTGASTLEISRVTPTGTFDVAFGLAGIFSSNSYYQARLIPQGDQRLLVAATTTKMPVAAVLLRLWN